jgi:hypothetical protein
MRERSRMFLSLEWKGTTVLVNSIDYIVYGSAS